MTRANTKAKDPSWQLQEAKSRLRQVVDHALREGPQTITLRGKLAVVVVSMDRQAAGRRKKRKTAIMGQQ